MLFAMETMDSTGCHVMLSSCHVILKNLSVYQNFLHLLQVLVSRSYRHCASPSHLEFVEGWKKGGPQI